MTYLKLLIFTFLQIFWVNVMKAELCIIVAFTHSQRFHWKVIAPTIFVNSILFCNLLWPLLQFMFCTKMRAAAILYGTKISCSLSLSQITSRLTLLPWPTRKTSFNLHLDELLDLPSNQKWFDCFFLSKHIFC